MVSADPSVPPPDWLMVDAADALLRTRARQAVATADLFLPADGRLRDDDRAVIGRLLADLVALAEAPLRATLADALAPHAAAAMLRDTAYPIAAPILARTGALRDPALVTALTRRAQAARLAARLRDRTERAREVEAGAASPVGPLVEDADPAVRAAARDFVRVTAVAHDAAGSPAAMPAELAAEGQHRFVWRVAAALRDHLRGVHFLPAAIVDPAIAAAVAVLLAGYDETATLAGHAGRLTRVLYADGRLDDGFVTTALAAAEPLLTTAALAVRASVGIGVAWDMLCDPDQACLLLLCRAAGLAAAPAADLALRLAADDTDEALAAALDGYAVLPPEDASAALGLWRCDPAYREAILALSAEPRG